MVKKSFECSFPLEYMIAFGGVETGKAIANEALKATAMAAITKDSELKETLNAITIGSIIFEAAVLLIKFEIKTTKYENTINSIIIELIPSGKRVANHKSRPVLVTPSPRVSPPIISIITSHLMALISSLVIIPKSVNNTIGIKDITVVGIWCSGPVSQRSIVIQNL